MKHRQLCRWTKLRCIVSLVVFMLVFLPTLTCAQAGGSVGSRGSPAAAVTNAENRGASPSAQVTSAPNAPRWPFLRLIAILSSGLVITAARLARKFRRFLGLGVFTNPYAVLFLIFGMGVCGIPVTSESALSTIPALKSLAPWIAGLSGIIVA